MKNASSFGWITALILVAAIVGASMKFVDIDLETLKNEDILTVFLTAIFVALVIERAVEVYANSHFEPKRRHIRQPISILIKRLEIKNKALNAELERPESSDEEEKNARKIELEDLRGKIKDTREKLTAEEEKAIPKLEDLANRKVNYARSLALILGLTASVVGVRVLGQFLPADSAIRSGGGYDSQIFWFHFADIVLTTALLAGGADGIHKIVKRFTDIRDNNQS